MTWNKRRGNTPSSGSPGAPSTPREEPSPYQRALGLLVRREHSRKELTRKLVAKGVDRDALEPALDILSRQDFQNDTRFAAALARSRAAAGYGPVRIRAELATHGLPREAIADAIEACERDWTDSALDVATRRFGGKDLRDPAARRKALDFLLRRGFEQRGAQAALAGLAGNRAAAADDEDADNDGPGDDEPAAG
jgi:regulatory protein